MANRNFANGGKIYSMNVMPVMLNLQITIGASGAVSASSGKGIYSVSKTGTGTYRITMQDRYFSLLSLIGNAKVASGVSGMDHIEQLGSLTASGNRCYVDIQTVLAGAVANATSGAVLNVVLLLNNSSVQ